MHTQIELPRWKYYLSSIVFGSVMNLAVLLILLTYFGFTGKNLFALCYISIQGCFIKSLIFYLPWLFIGDSFLCKPRMVREFIFFLPFIFFLTWFGFIILFQIWALFFEISYGYLDRFPHFYTQLITALFLCVFIRNRILKRIR